MRLKTEGKVTKLVTECRESGWGTALFSVEFGTSSTTHLLQELRLRGKDIGLRGTKLPRAV